MRTARSGLGLLGCAALLGLVGCAHSQPQKPVAWWLVEDELDTLGVYEGVFRHLMNGHAAPDVVFCLGILTPNGMEDAPPGLLARFQKDALQVAPFSECQRAHPDTVFRPENPALATAAPLPPGRARTFFVRAIEAATMVPCEPPRDVAWLEGEITCGSFCSQRATFQLERHDGHWAVVDQAVQPQ